eukprot:COSAG06_NODE_2551_length_6684_cov_3.568565_4_plen_147_part_00
MRASYYFGATLRCVALWLPVAGVMLHITTTRDDLPDLLGQRFGVLGVLVSAVGWCYEHYQCSMLLKRTGAAHGHGADEWALGHDRGAARRRSRPLLRDTLDILGGGFPRRDTLDMLGGGLPHGLDDLLLDDDDRLWQPRMMDWGAE